MASMASRNRVAFDADARVKLRDLAGAAVTVTTAEVAIPLDILTKAYWDAADQTQGVFTIALDILSIKTVAGNETYLFQVEVDTVALMTTPIEVLRLNLLASVAGQAKPGYVELTLSHSLIEYMKPGAAFIRIRATLAGTTPNVVYGAQIAYQDN